MKFFTKLLLFVTMCLLSQQMYAQLSFTNQNALLNGDNFSGVAIAVTDVNGDMLDDIVRLNQGTVLNVQYQTAGGGQFTEYLFGSVANNSQWMLAAADCNNNGFADFMSGDYTHSRYVTADATGALYAASEFPGNNFFAQGANFADINNDGLLDAFICNDNGESYIYQNDGQGGFIEANDWIDMSINGSSGEDASGNYGSTWTDFDNDGDLDLYIAHCRQGVGNQTDERRINKLFVNDGSNNYTEMGGEYGLRIGYQSWTAEFNDIDNDGDFDCFITNHDYINQLLENDGSGHFTDITAGSGLDYNGTPIQGIMRDFDNDGFIDLLVTGSNHQIYMNNGDKTFTALAENPFDDEDMESFALGDLNNDGFVDIYGGYANIYTNPSNIPDVLWMNDGNSNNHIAIHLSGLTSNRDGVGSRIEIYGDWGMQVREVRAGESYGISNSVTSYFGIGQSTEISHIIVKWPSGIVDVIENPSINQTLEVVEGSCLPADIDITYTGSTVFCSGETFTMTAPAGLNYFWSNGANTQEITVDAPGNYSVIVENASGCFDLSNVVSVEVDPDETPTVEAGGPIVFCEGESVTLSSSEATAYMWSNGMTSQSIEVTTAGNYTVQIEGMCGSFTSQAIEVEVTPTAATPEADDVYLTAPGEVTLEATGTNLSWYDAEVGGNLLGTGPTYYIPLASDLTTYYYVENSEAVSIYHGPVDHEGNSEYSGNQYNGQVIFDCYTAFKLKSVKVLTDSVGARIIELRNASGDVLASQMVEVPVGESRINLDFVVEPGTNYLLTTNEASNQLEFGFDAPRFQRSSGGVNYPYTLPDVVSLTGSNLGTNRYYYFYDWEIQTPPVDCISDRVEVLVSVGDVSVIDIKDTDQVNVFPNPGNGLFNVELNLDVTDAKLILTSITGQQLMQKELGAISGMVSHELNLTDLAKGSYLLQVQTEANTYYTKLILN